MPRGQSGEWLLQQTHSAEPFKAFVPFGLPPKPPLDLAALALLQEKASQALGRLDGISKILPNTGLFLSSYIRKEAIVSSQIEGTQSSLSDLMLLELNEPDEVAHFHDVTETLRYVKALLHGKKRLQEDGFPMSLRLLKEVHAILLTDGRGQDKQPGEFRSTQNWIGGSRPGNAIFVPPPPHALMACLDQWEKFLHDETIQLPVLIKAGLAHAQFETIHPFLDGNGRLGRLFIALWLFEQDLLAEPILYLSLYLKTHRDHYYQLLTETRTTGNWEAWLLFFLQGVYETANQAYKDGKQLLAIIEEDRDKLPQLGRSASTANHALDALQQSPYITGQVLAAKLQVSITTANKALDNLHALGIVSEVTGYRRNRVFAYTRVMSILAEGTEPL